MPFDTSYSTYQPETTTSDPVDPYIFIGTPYGNINLKPNREKAKTFGINLGIALASFLILYITYKIYLSRRTKLCFPIPNLTNVVDEGGLTGELEAIVVSGGSTNNMSNIYIHQAAYKAPTLGKRGAIKVDNSKGHAKVFMEELQGIMKKGFPYKHPILYVSQNSYIYTAGGKHKDVIGVRITDNGLAADHLCSKDDLDAQVNMEDADSVFESMIRKKIFKKVEPYLVTMNFLKDDDGNVTLPSKPNDPAN